MDVIRALHAGQISPDRAEDEITRLIQRCASPPADEDPQRFLECVDMSVREYTAYCHGASAVDLVKLRHEGWPATCAHCGEPIDYDAGFWLHTATVVHCVRCPDHPAAEVVPWVDV
jgi:hypothetical protein